MLLLYKTVLVMISSTSHRITVAVFSSVTFTLVALEGRTDLHAQGDG